MALKYIQATLYIIRSETVFPGEVLSGDDGVPREQVLQHAKF